MPGQGRATADSHYDLPVVQASADQLLEDLSIFKALASSATMGMTCHVVFEAFDPHLPTTISETVISRIIRERIGFEGLVMTDDLGMDALGGDLKTRGTKALAAGCDVLLHCSGFLKDPSQILTEMEQVAEAAGELSGEARVRATRAEAALTTAEQIDKEQSWARFSELLSDMKASV